MTNQPEAVPNNYLAPVRDINTDLMCEHRATNRITQETSCGDILDLEDLPAGVVSLGEARDKHQEQRADNSSPLPQPPQTPRKCWTFLRLYLVSHNN